MNIVLDCETIDRKYNFICDLAWVCVERNKIVAVHNYIPREYLALMPMGEFSAPKQAKTLQEVSYGRATIKPYAEIMEILKADAERAKYIYAYNANFDRSKVSETCKDCQLTAFAEFFDSSAIFDKWRDLWAWASHTILYKKSFIDFCEVHGLKTPKGFCSTSAETCLKFLRNDISYVEEHTALADVYDEFEIYLAIKKATKKEYAEEVADEKHFKGKPFYTIKKLQDAIEG